MRKKTLTPTARSLRLLRSEGWVCDVVERYNHHSGRRNDCFGVADILAFHPTKYDADDAVMLVQATDGTSVSKRLKKCREWEHLDGWPGRFEVHGWRKNAAGKWVCRRVEV